MGDEEATSLRNANCDFNVAPIVLSGDGLKCFNGRAAAARFYIGLCIMPRCNAFPFPPPAFLSKFSVLSRNLLDFRATIPPLLLNQREFRVRRQLLTCLPHTLARLVIVYGAGFFARSRTISG